MRAFNRVFHRGPVHVPFSFQVFGVTARDCFSLNKDQLFDVDIDVSDVAIGCGAPLPDPIQGMKTVFVSPPYTLVSISPAKFRMNTAPTVRIPLGTNPEKKKRMLCLSLYTFWAVWKKFR